MGAYKFYITYYGPSAWLEETGETLERMIASLKAFIHDELSEMFPDHEVTASLCTKESSCVFSDDPDIDVDELDAFVERKIIWEWCETCLDPIDGSLIAT